MNTPDLLAEINRRGVKITLHEGALQFEAPRGSMRDLLPLVAQMKAELIGALESGLDQSAAPRVEVPTRYPFAPIEILNAAHAQGVEVTSYGWPVSYWPGDYVEELKAWKERESIHPTETTSDRDTSLVSEPAQIGLFEIREAA